MQADHTARPGTSEILLYLQQGVDLSFCVLNLLLELNTLPSLVAIRLVKVEKYFFFNFSCDPTCPRDQRFI